MTACNLTNTKVSSNYLCENFIWVNEWAEKYKCKKECFNCGNGFTNPR